MAKLYTTTQVQKLIDRYIEKGGEVATISEGGLGHGHMVLFGEDLKTTVIQEVVLNEWSSAHKVRMYNNTPAKYMDVEKESKLFGE